MKRTPLLVTAGLVVAGVALFILSSQGQKKLSDAAFVARFIKHPDKKVQDQVGNARIRLAYETAKTGDFKGARAAFLATAKEYRGTGAMSAEFGGIPDGAAYQAAATYNAEGDRKESIRAFRQFLKDYPLSPLVYGAHKRLTTWDRGRSAEYDALLEACTAKQEAKSKLDQVACGPRCVEYLLGELGKTIKSYEELARLCATTKDGTTMMGLQKGLAKLGIPSFGYRLNRSDLARLHRPSILLHGDHYVVLLAAGGEKAHVYDPSLKATSYLSLSDKPEFTCDVLALDRLNLEDN